MGAVAAVGHEDIDLSAGIYNEIAPGASKQARRPSDMTLNHAEAAMRFVYPSSSRSPDGARRVDSVVS
jgi:hypothetical protein